MTKNYSNGEVTVHWQPEKCIHSGRCFRSLPSVFRPNERPWIVPSGAPTADIVQTVKNCPSGALTYSVNAGKQQNTAPQAVPQAEIRLAHNGPLLVRGTCVLTDEHGKTISTGSTFALCRCGASGKKPFCDGSHKLIGFVAQSDV